MIQKFEFPKMCHHIWFLQIGSQMTKIFCILVSTAGCIWPAYILDCVSIRAVELLAQVLWLMKFLQKKSWCSHLHVISAIDRFSQSLIHWLVDHMGRV